MPLSTRQPIKTPAGQQLARVPLLDEPRASGNSQGVKNPLDLAMMVSFRVIVSQ